MFVIGVAMIPRITKERTTAATGRFITRRAVCAQRPSSFGVIAERLTTPLSIFDPIRARIGGSPTSAPTTASNLPSVNFAGDKVSTRWGPVQVEITVKNGVITSANALAYPDGDRRSLSISQQAIPYLIEQTLGVVKSSEVMGVSGASYTSNGWRTSLQSAIKKAGI